jgi:hypothetical protein
LKLNCVSDELQETPSKRTLSAQRTPLVAERTVHHKRVMPVCHRTSVELWRGADVGRPTRRLGPDSGTSVCNVSNPRFASSAGGVLPGDGEDGRSQEIVERRREADREGPVPPSVMAMGSLLGEETESALGRMEKAIQQHDIWLLRLNQYLLSIRSGITRERWLFSAGFIREGRADNRRHATSDLLLNHLLSILLGLHSGYSAF